MNKKQLQILNFMTLPMLILMGFASWMGMTEESVYARETTSIAVQGIGQDFVNLFIGGPILLVSLILLNRGSKTASWIFAGMVFYYLYSYSVYTFGIRHNDLFLVYCFVLALSTYLLIFWIYFTGREDIKSIFSEKPPTKFAAWFFLFIAIVFYTLWLKDIVPPLLKGEAPKFVIENDYAINPIHAVDLSFALPALIITAVLLFKDHKLAYLLAPVLNVFIIILTIALIAMVIMLKKEGISEDMSVAFIFAFLSLIGLTLLYFFLKPMSKTEKQ